jgi:alkane 1-monooxygenase
VMTIALWAVLLVWLGVGILPFLFIQAFIAITLLEAVNYLEHYGMLRQRVGAPGRERYERVDPTHSWNSNNIATNVLLYHLQRHSDHHAKPTRRYQALRDYEESPALPTGYAGMILLSLVPWAWRRVMDPRVARHFNGDMRLANIQPRKRERILSAYPIPEAAAESASTAPDPIDTSAAEVWQGRAFQCPSCRYVYDEVAGDRREGFAPGTSWALIPDTWCCPDCGVRDKVDFVVLERTDA